MLCGIPRRGSFLVSHHGEEGVVVVRRPLFVYQVIRTVWCLLIDIDTSAPYGVPLYPRFLMKHETHCSRSSNNNPDIFKLQPMQGTICRVCLFRSYMHACMNALGDAERLVAVE